MGEVRRIAETDQLHGNVLVRDTAGDGRVRGGQDARPVGTTCRIAQLARRLGRGPVTQAMPVVRNSGRGIDGIARGAIRIYLLTVAVALRRRERLLVIV